VSWLFILSSGGGFSVAFGRFAVAGRLRFALISRFNSRGFTPSIKCGVFPAFGRFPRRFSVNVSIFKDSRHKNRRSFDGIGGGWFSLFVWFFVRGLVVSLLCPLCLVGSPQAVAACPVSVWNTPFLSCPRDFCVGRGSYLSFYLYTLCGVSLSRFQCPLAGVLAIRFLIDLSGLPFVLFGFRSHDGGGAGGVSFDLITEYHDKGILASVF
jgi:hypothetical protein